MQNIQQSTSDILHSFSYLKAEWTLVTGFLVVILLDLFIQKSKIIVFIAAMLTLLMSAAFLTIQITHFSESKLLFNGMFSLTKSGIQFKFLVLFASFLSLIFFYQDERLKLHPKGINDFISIFLVCILGMFLLISSANLLMLYLSIEMISLASYLMVSYNAYQNKQAEAGMKYILFGAVASAMMLYGISLIYGFTGSIDLYGDTLNNGLMQIGDGGAALALILFVAGIGFKLSFVPFHFWTPDAYQMAPTSVTAFLSTAPKIAVFALLFAIAPLMNGIVFLQLILWVAAASMILGNATAIFQHDAKRMMAYSSIGHTGFILMLFLLPQILIFKALFFYLLVYIIMNMGTFMVLSFMESRFKALNIAEYKGLGKQLPLAGILLVIFMISLTGLPPTAGFFAKFLVFSSLLVGVADHTDLTILLVIAAITTVVSLFYYLKIPLNYFLKKADGEREIQQTSMVLIITGTILAVILLIIGVFPSVISL